MSNRLTTEQVEQYRRNGFLSPLRAYTREEALALRRKLEESEAQYGPFAIGGNGSKPHLLFPWIDALTRHPAILDAVESLIGPDILIYTLTMWIKAAHDPGYVGWHQDASYFGLDPMEQVTVWVALSDANEKSGCVQVIPGSHRKLLHHSERNREGKRSMLPRSQSVTNDIDTSRAVSMPLSPGEFSMHDTLAIHGSEGNESDDRRIGVGISYIPARARFIGSRRITAMLVRGEDRYGYYDPERRPTADCEREARAFHEKTLANYFASKKELAKLYEGGPENWPA